MEVIGGAMQKEYDALKDMPEFSGSPQHRFRTETNQTEKP